MKKKKDNRVDVIDITPNDGTMYAINGNLQTIVNIEPGPVWLNEEHTHLVCPEDWLLVTTDGGSRIPVYPGITFIVASRLMRVST